jgi:TfuA protein
VTTPHVRVYLGPTLSHDEARRILDAEYRPPITDRDLSRDINDGVEIVGIIDGTFFQTYTATPTQVLDCLRRGMIVYGAASAGALRAVETDRFGMRGVGGIYKLYKSGFDAEDELAVVYDPETLRSLSTPMINVRYALSRGLAEGVIEQAAHDRLLAIAKAIYFAHRTYPLVYHNARGDVPDTAIDAFRSFVAANMARLDWKLQDAIECLHAIRACVAQSGSFKDSGPEGS